MVPNNLNLDRHVDNEKTRGNLSIDYQFADVTHSPIKTPSHKDSSIKVNLLCLDQYMYTLDKERCEAISGRLFRKKIPLKVMMDCGDLKTLNRWHGGDLETLSRQHGGIFGLLGKLFGLGPGVEKQHGGIIGLLGKLFGFGPGELQKQMSDPIKQQMIMQRGGFPWALAGLSLLAALLGKGEEDRIRNQMQMTRDPIMQRGGLAIPPALISKGLPLLKQIGIPTAMGALASLGDNLVDEIFGDGKTKGIRKGIRRGVQRTKGFRPKKGFRLKKGAPRFTSKHQGKKQMFQKLGTRWQHRQDHQEVFQEEKKTRRVAKKALHKVGRELFPPKKIRLESKPQDTPFAKQLRESIKMVTPQLDSSHIGQTFNI